MNKKFLFLLCLILVLTLSAVSAQDSLNQITGESSDTLAVSQGDENGAFTELQEKINNAENESTINLDKNYVYDGDKNGEGIVINRNITINGNGYTIDGNHASRIFYINASNVVLNSITFINGQTKSNGGAIQDKGPDFDDIDMYQNLEINDCSFINCVAEDCGGAIYFNGHLAIKNATFIDNKAGSGGAIFSWNDFNPCLIENSRFLNNSLLAGETSTWIKGGGAIFFGCCQVDIKNSTFKGNRATNEDDCGGAIVCYESVSGSIDNSIFLNNSAGRGSTFYVAIFSNLEVSNSIINNPFTEEQIYVDGGSSGSYAGFHNVSYDDFKNQSFYVWEGIICFKTRIMAQNLEKTFGDDKRLYIQLTDINSNPLKNEEVSIKINGVTYTKITDDEGMASMAINLGAGQYEASIYFGGDDIKYSSSENVSYITINSSIFSENYMQKYCRDSQPFEAGFLDKKGNHMTGGKATFNINGVIYERDINPDGIARLNINLNPGNYIITATNPDTGEMSASSIEILPTIIDNHDLVKYYRNDSQYAVRIDGNGDLANKEVTFNINGVLYKRYTNESGHAQLNINLQPGDYIITAEYNGYMVSNNIAVISVLNSSDLEMTYLDGSTFNVTVLDGQGSPYAGQEVTFNINGVFYKRTTGEDGIARLNINLLEGKYIITTMYNGLNAANKVTISS